MDEDADLGLMGVPTIDNAQKKVVIEGISGKGILSQPTSACGSSNGINYPFPIIVTWQATVEIPDQFLGLEIDPTEQTLAVGQTQHFTVYANWNQDGVTKRYEVADSKLTWTSDAAAKAPVDSGGTVTGLQVTPGTTYVTIKATFAEQNASVTAKVRVIDSGGTIHVRHMARSSPGGSYANRGETTTVVASLPDSRTVGADSSYGSVTGKSLSYSAFSDTASSGSTAAVSLSSSQKTAYVSFFYDKFDSFTGDFDVLPGTIEYRQSFKLHPKNFQLNACTYISHQWRIDRSGSYMSPLVYNQFSDTAYGFGSYPWNFGTGTSAVYMKITTSCGTSDWIGPKPLTVTSPSANHPPGFTVGFVDPAHPTVPLTQIVQGRKVDLIFINDPSVPTPFDPDGDQMTFNGFDTAGGNAFVQSIPSNSTEYANGYHNLEMDTAGFHSVTGMMSDEWGATTTASTSIQVIPANPIAIPTCPAVVVENRPVSLALFSGNQSYSLLGYAIDHSKDQWSNRLTAYANGTSGDISVQVGLHVFDSKGLKSLDQGTCSITVKPDLPPVAKLDVPSAGIRGQDAGIFNKSYSPDGDTIVQTEYKYKYDANNNGFADDDWQAVAGTVTKINFAPSRVGKYLFYVKVTENYGKWGDTAGTAESTLTLNVLNNGPEVSFSMEGSNPQPDLNPFATIKAADMLNWPLYESNSTNLTRVPKENLWRIAGGKLVSDEGRNFGAQSSTFHYLNQKISNVTKASIESFAMNNNGFGNNRLSPWRSIAPGSSFISGPLINTATHKPLSFSGPAAIQDMKIRSNKKMIYFNMPRYSTSGETGKIYAVDTSKLSPLEEYSDGSSTYSYRYTGADPYAFVLERPTTGRSITISGAAKNAGVQYILDYEQTGKYLYAQRYWRVSKGGSNYSYYTEIAVFNAFTGEQLRSSFDLGDIMTTGVLDWQGKLLYTKGNNLVLKSVDLSKKEIRFIELTPELQVVRDIRQPWPVKTDDAKSTTQFEALMSTDASGAIYSVQYYYNSGYNSARDLNITKYNPDFSLAWRTYLPKPTGSTMLYPAYGGTMYASYTYLDDYPSIVYDPANNEVLAKFYYDQVASGHVTPDPYERLAVIDGASGGIKAVKSHTDGDFGSYHYGNNEYGDLGTMNYSMNWNGRLAGRQGTVTADGNMTVFNPTAVCALGSISGTNDVYDANGNLIAQVGAPCNYRNQAFGEYYGDGVYVSMSSHQNNSSNEMRLNISVGAPTTSPKVAKSFTDGQFVSSGTMDNAEVKFGFSMEDVDYDPEWLGFSFRMQDPKNRYSVETDGRTIALVKYAAGARTVLTSAAYTMQDNTTYNVRLKFLGTQMEVWLNGIPILSASDSAYASGKYGYWGDKSYITFGDIQHKTLTAAAAWSDQYAIWDAGTATAQVKYSNLTYTDPENDPPAGSYQWKIKHTVRFIDNQGVSALHGQTFSSEQLVFDKVGDYEVTLAAKDDPHPSFLWPSMVFDGYRMPSNPFTRKVIVHRRPISDYAAAADAGGKVIWTDYSRDPDRYASAANYSTEATGIDYKATKGIMEKKFYFVSPNGTLSQTKLVAPTELGTYEIGMAVRDEYDAWSEYTVKYLNVTKLPPANTPPNPGFTTSPTTTYRGAAVAIDSTASDTEDGARTNLPHTYYLRNLTTGGAESIASSSRTSWTKTFSTMGTFQIRQLVEDSAGAQAEISRTVSIVNRQPSAAVTVPDSAEQNAPTKLTVLRPTFHWSYSDPDSDGESRYQVRIYQYGGTLQLDSGVQSGSFTSWIPAADLPEHQYMYVQVRVNDGYDWGDWSAAKYFYIETNRPPLADFDWSPKPVYEGDELTVVSLSSDPDNDELTHMWTAAGPAGYVKSFSTPAFSIPAAAPGTYTVTLTVSDGQASVIAVQTVEVLPLNLTAAVTHTAEWLAVHEEAGHQTTADPKDFYGGEKIVVRARTSPAAVSKVTVSLHTKDMKGRPLNTDAGLQLSRTPSLYEGVLWDERWGDLTEGLPKGVETLRFAVTYMNGTIKTVDVPVRIIGNMLKAVSVHRQQ